MKLHPIYALMFLFAVTFSAHAQSPVSDDFSAPTLNTGLWTVVDPTGDGSVSVNGTQLEMSIPAGVEHHPWTGGNDALRVLQPCTASSFQVEAKFESAVTERYQMQGIMVQETPTKYLRAEFHHTGSAIKIFAATLNGGSSSTKIFSTVNVVNPQYLRVTRSNNSWTIAYSGDGTNWTTAGQFSTSLAVTQVGPFVGNTGTNIPAHTALVDYFFNTASPIDPEDGGSNAIQTSVVGSGSIALDPDKALYADGEMVEVTATPAANWVFDSWIGDLSGMANPENYIVGGNYEFTAIFEQLISNISVVSGSEQGTVSFNTNTPATASVAYGLTTNYELGSVATADGAAATEHSVNLTGLTAGSTYNVRITATDGQGRTATSSNLTFVPLAASGIASDDFSNEVLSGNWTFVNPAGDGSMNLNGTQLELSVPAGTTHAAWTNNYDAPRVMQNISNSDFDVELKFESDVTERYQQQGLVIEASETSFVRVEFYHDGSSAFIFAGVRTPGGGSNRFNLPITISQPMWMRVNRTGNLFTVWYSDNGTDWTQAGSFSATLAVSKIGPYVANTNGPAHTAVIDYFFDTNEPIVPEDGGLSVVNIATAGNGTVQKSPNKPEYIEGEELTLTATPAANWSFAGWSGDLTGTTNPLTLTVPSSLNLTANFNRPIVTNLQVFPGTDNALIVWDLASPGVSTLRYGISSINENTVVAAGGATQVNFEEMLTGLAPETTYFYEVSASDGMGGTHTSGVQTFTTIDTTILSDDFSSPTLNENIWTFVNPLGDGTLEFNGTHAIISVPQGTNHDNYTGGAFAPRLTQNVPNVDFDVVAKFESELTAQYQMLGILVEQDAGNFLRFELYSNGSQIRAFAATIINNSGSTKLNSTVGATVPYYLRVKRQGNVWTMYYSANGENWTQAVQFTQALTMNQIGPYAGNVGAQHTGWIDYFESAGNPLLNEDGDSRVVSLSTSGQGTAVISPQQATYAEGEQVTLTATPANNWKFTGWTGSITSTVNPYVLTVSGDKTITANFAQLIQAWVIDADETEATVTIQTATPTTLQVAYGTTTGYELGTASSLTAKTVHTVTLTGLTPGGVQHHFEITATDGSGGTAVSGDVSFYTYSEAIIVSDDFHSPALNTGLWTFVDPLGNSTLTMSGTQAVISIPGGTTHEIWNGGINSPRLMQSANDTDFEVEAKFDSALTSGFQMQGIAVEAAPGHVVRLELYTNGNSIYAFGGVVNNGVVSTRFNNSISIQPPHFLRVNRTGNVFTLSYSADGQNWQVGGTLTEAMNVSAVGPYIGNISVAHTGVIDYFFNTASPISPEDDGEFSLVVNVNGQGMVTRNPDLATYSSGQQVELTAQGLNGWTFSNWSGVLSGSNNPETITVTGDSIVFANFVGEGGTNTIFDIWYGDEQSFGTPGLGQVWVDILGTVTDPDGLLALSYSVNGGPSNPLTIGPDGRRLQGTGDFIAQIPHSDLADGANTILITATDQQADQSFKTVTVNFDSDGFVPENYAINWSQVTSLQEAVQAVDGKWTYDNNGLRNVSVGYDRVVTVGDSTWTDYEVTIPMTVHSFDPAGFGGINGAPGAGFIVRWTGHTDEPIACPQPLCGWLPFGNVVWYRWDETGGVSSTFSPGNLKLQNQAPLQFDVTYFYKVRVETAPGQNSVYSFKIWQQGNPEPAWMKTIEGPTSKATGSVLLIAHWTEVTFGNITVTGLNADQPISQVEVEPASDGATISWATGELSQTRLNYGTTSSYELGTVVEPALKLGHEVVLTSLTPETLYQYEILADDGNGGTFSSGNLLFQTFPEAGPPNLITDQFDDAELNSELWEVVDPLGQGQAYMTGTQLALEVPAGVLYESWTSGNFNIRALQPVADVDFDVRMKLNSLPKDKYSSQGFLIEQDADTYLRFDFLGVGNKTNLYVGELDNGSANSRYNKRISITSAPVHMRVVRTGDLWQVSYGPNGLTWYPAYSFQRPMTVTKVGLAAGNGAPMPGHTMLADYFLSFGE